MQRVVKGIHDGIRVAAGLGETLVGRPLGLPRLAGPQCMSKVSVAGRNLLIPRLDNVKSGPLSWHIGPPIPPTADVDAPNPPPEKLRSVMRLLPQGVVVCTATHEGAPRAMTMSSFTSLTLKPVPVVTFNVATPSRTLDAITSSRCFNIHVLSGDANGAAVADHFTRGNVKDVFEDLEDTTCEKGSGAPVLQGKGVVYVLKCRVMDDAPSQGLMRVRDHVIVAGEVVEMAKGSDAQEFALAYADRQYRQIGSVITKS